MTEQMTPAVASNLAAVGEPHAAGGALVVEEDAVGVGAEANVAALVADQALERGERLARAAFDDRRAGGFEREGDRPCAIWPE